MDGSGTTPAPHPPDHDPESSSGGGGGGDDDYRIFHLGDFQLESGETIPDAWLAYKTYGDTSTATARQQAKPLVVYPTWFSGAIADNEWLIGARRALDPARYTIVVPALIGNGQSVSPSNTRALPWRRDRDHGRLLPFPRVTVRDNVTAQHRLVTSLYLHDDSKEVQEEKIHLVLGWSMAAAQTYQWITQFPALVGRAAPFCGSARTSPHNWVFLEGVRAALTAPVVASAAPRPRQPQDDDDGYALEWSASQAGVALRAVARVYAGWGLSQQFYRERLHETRLGFRGLEDFMVGFWEKWALSKDPENLLHMIHTWQDADCSQQAPYDGDLAAAMAAVRARTLVLPGRTDLYFPPEDSVNEVSCMRPGVGTCLPFPSIWGHWAGGPGVNTEDVEWLDNKLKELLKDE